MSTHTELQIHKTGVELLTLIADVQAALPRTFRHYGNRIGEECTDILIAIARANAAKGATRAAQIEHMLERLDVVQIMLRVAKAKKLIGPELWSKTALVTGSIGRQGGGWLKSASRSAPAA